MSRAAVDNDVLLKLCIYSLHGLLRSDPICGIQDMACLGVARYLLPKIVGKKSTSPSKEVVLQNIDELLAQMAIIEPTQEELELAASFESSANEQNLPLDIGESQLCAIVMNRSWDYLLTGDKRAISAIGALHNTNKLQGLAGKLICLEQIFLYWLKSNDAFIPIRECVCAAPECDKALSLSFSCRSQALTLDSCTEGLKSYVRDVRRTANGLLLLQGISVD
ncbi:hypothetical protein [Rheinheimera texasensis]|uniref:hypothetical protein n=1 Tax=Rheinheimera texasensis TaxID=306205 RepID=UPI0032B1100C